MALIKPIRGIHPRIGKNCFLADNATIIGDVIMGDDCSVWFNAVVRGDVHYIKIGNNVNIQDNAVVHATYQKSPTNIGDNVSIAHGAVVHGCTIQDNVLIGMGAMVMDNVVIGGDSIIAAGAVVIQGTRVETSSVYAGTPAKKVKSMDKDLLQGEVLRIANNYRMFAGWYKDESEKD